MRRSKGCDMVGPVKVVSAVWVTIDLNRQDAKSAKEKHKKRGWRIEDGEWKESMLDSIGFDLLSSILHPLSSLALLASWRFKLSFSIRVPTLMQPVQVGVFFYMSSVVIVGSYDFSRQFHYPRLE